MKHMGWLTLALLPALLLAFPQPGSAATTTGETPTWQTIGWWRMNETSGSRLVDSSALGLHGVIGGAVALNGRYHALTLAGYVERSDREAIDVVPDNEQLNPGSDDFSVTAQIWWGPARDRNIVQKGQGSPAGGMFKMKTSVRRWEPLGGVKCLFRGSRGDSTVNSYSMASLADQQWHTVTCLRTHEGTEMRVDGVTVDQNPRQPGWISNNWPLAIGGNTYCQDGENSCNFWPGRIGFVRIGKAF